MKRQIAFIFALSVLLPAAGCGEVTAPRAQKYSAIDGLVGAWRGKVQFKSGMLDEWKGLEFMYAFNAGGTMTSPQTTMPHLQDHPPMGCGEIRGRDNSKPVMRCS